MRLSLEYIAAFLDCDGSVCIVESKRKNRRDEYYVKVNFYSQNLEVLNDIKETIGGKITPPNTSMVHTLQLSPKTSVEALKSLVPYLRIKRQQGILALEFDRQKRSYKRVGKKNGLSGQEPIPDDVFNRRITLCRMMQGLNHKDSQAFRTNRVNSVELSKETIPSQFAVGKDPAEGVTTREVSPNNNPLQETPTRKGRDSLSCLETSRSEDKEPHDNILIM